MGSSRQDHQLPPACPGLPSMLPTRGYVFSLFPAPTRSTGRGRPLRPPPPPPPRHDSLADCPFDTGGIAEISALSALPLFTSSDADRSRMAVRFVRTRKLGGYGRALHTLRFFFLTHFFFFNAPLRKLSKAFFKGIPLDPEESPLLFHFL